MPNHIEPQLLPSVTFTELETVDNISVGVRDIVFDGRGLSPANSLNAEILQIKKKRKGTCSAKHYLMGNLLEAQGLSLAYLSYPFRWNQLNIDFPQKIKTLVEKMPPQNHLALVGVINSNIFFVDVTWDKGIQHLGFPIWIDSKTSGFQLAVKPIELPIVHLSAQKRWDYLADLRSRMEYNPVVAEFYSALFLWLGQARKIINLL